MQLLWITMVRLRTYYRLWNQNAILCFSFFLLAITLMPYLVFFFIPVSVKKLEVVVFTFLKELLPGYFM